MLVGVPTRDQGATRTASRSHRPACTNWRLTGTQGARPAGRRATAQPAARRRLPEGGGDDRRDAAEVWAAPNSSRSRSRSQEYHLLRKTRSSTRTCTSRPTARSPALMERRIDRHRLRDHPARRRLAAAARPMSDVAGRMADAGRRERAPAVTRRQGHPPRRRARRRARPRRRPRRRRRRRQRREDRRRPGRPRHHPRPRRRQAGVPRRHLSGAPRTVSLEQLELEKAVHGPTSSSAPCSSRARGPEARQRRWCRTWSRAASSSTSRSTRAAASSTSARPRTRPHLHGGRRDPLRRAEHARRRAAHVHLRPHERDDEVRRRDRGQGRGAGREVKTRRSRSA